MNKTLEEVIESFGGVCVRMNNEHFGKVEVLVHYDDFLTILMERQRSCFYDEKRIYLLQAKKDHYSH